MPGSDSTTGFQRQLLIEGQDADRRAGSTPTDYTVSKANRWSDGRQLSEEFPQREFIGGDPRELTLTLLFDAADTDNDDVADVTDQLFTMLEVQPEVESGKNTARPPTVTFRGGRCRASRRSPPACACASRCSTSTALRCARSPTSR